MTILQNPSQVLKTRKVLVLKDWTAAQQQVEELGLGVWESIKSAWNDNELYANVQLRTPVLLIGDEWAIFINGLYDDQPASPYPSWTWNTFTKKWEAPIPQPTNPVTEYDLLWNEDTQGWGLANVSRHKIKTIIFPTWKELKQYLSDNDQLINTYNQLSTQEQLATAEEREIICPEGAHFVSLRCQG